MENKSKQPSYNGDGPYLLLNGSAPRLYGTSDSIASAAARPKKQKTPLTNPQVVRILLQTVTFITAQVLKQYFYASSFPKEAAQFGIISESASEDSSWLWGFVLPDLFFRFVVVLLSRTPSIIEDVSKPKSHTKITDMLVHHVLPERLRYSSGGNGAPVASRVTAMTQVHSVLGTPQVRELEYQHSLRTIEPELSVYKYHKHRYQSAYRIGLVWGATDSAFAIFSTTFFAVHAFNAIQSGAKVEYKWLIAALGCLLGVSGAVTYFSFRVPRSVVRMNVIQAAIKHSGGIDKANIDAEEYRSARCLARWVALMAGIYIFFAGYKMTENFFELISDHTQSWHQIFKVGVALIGSATSANTNYCNMMSARWKHYFNDTHVFEDEDEDDASDDEFVSTSGADLTCGARLVGGIGLLSVTCDWCLSVMTMLFIERVVYNPKAVKWALYLSLSVAAVSLIPSNIRSFEYTIKKCMTKGVDMVSNLFGCERGEEDKLKVVEEGRSSLLLNGTVD